MRPWASAAPSARASARSRSGPGSRCRGRRCSPTRLIAANIVLFLLTNKISASSGLGFGGTLNSLGDRLVLYGPAVKHGQDYRLLSAAFIHFGLLHIGFNMYALYLLGSAFERYAGTVRFALVYFTAALSGSFGALILSPHAATAGASGAIFGVMGAMFVLERQRGMALLQSPIGFLDPDQPGIHVRHPRHLDRRPHRRPDRRRPGGLRALGLRPQPHGLRPARRALAARDRGDRGRIRRGRSRGRRMRVLRALRRFWPPLLGGDRADRRRHPDLGLEDAVGLLRALARQGPPGRRVPARPGRQGARGRARGSTSSTSTRSRRTSSRSCGAATWCTARAWSRCASWCCPVSRRSSRRTQDIQAMDTSQVVAEAVAEHALGKPVVIRHLGALVEEVTPGLPAAKAGVQDGEVITAVDGHKVQSATDLIHLTAGLHPGDTATFTFTHLGTVHLRTVREHRRQEPGDHRRRDRRRRPHRPYPGQGALLDPGDRRPVRRARIRPRDLRQPERPPPAARAPHRRHRASSTRSAT